MKKLSYIVVVLFSISLIATSCREQKTTGEKIEDAVENTGDAIEDTADDISDDLEDSVDDMK
ncbi:hypothetical protein HNV08_08475 [Winogradskyella eckloniae]|uniref:hypothetical protein n=1 Tax=Winogradskyella eckloniae TaxID=1089306 RepID=UPI001564F25D|nr:hypothetical protein [Winogradskyella eckloniae]NRD20082.1 hypothetical protein [Winogradskyella eckloniae]